jgi:hypothetical protein
MPLRRAFELAEANVGSSSATPDRSVEECPPPAPGMRRAAQNFGRPRGRRGEPGAGTRADIREAIGHTKCMIESWSAMLSSKYV